MAATPILAKNRTNAKLALTHTFLRTLSDQLSFTENDIRTCWFQLIENYVLVNVLAGDKSP